MPIEPGPERVEVTNLPTDTESGHLKTTLNNRTNAGLSAVSVLDLPTGAVELVKSWQITVPPQTTKIRDIIVGGDLVGPLGKCYLAGGEYRVRTDAVEGSALHMSIVDRDNVLGAFGPYGLVRTKLTGLTGITGTISVGDTVHGDTSGAKSKVLAVGADFVEITFDSGVDAQGYPIAWQAAEPLTFKDASGATVATAVLGLWDEGDVFEVSKYVKDEWVEGKDERAVYPGGSTLIPAGLYFRVTVYNAASSGDMRVKFGFLIGLE
jgi:hypothetical protein